jgi:nitrate reductase beta subunit
MSLTSILHSYKSFMTSLSQVVLLGHIYPFKQLVYRGRQQYTADSHFDAKEIWKRAAYDGNWDNTIEEMQSSGRSGVFRRWSIEKEVTALLPPWRGVPPVYYIKNVKVTFRKVQGSKDWAQADKVIPQLNIEWIPW